jgi:hypothetical protein
MKDRTLHALALAGVAALAAIGADSATLAVCPARPITRPPVGRSKRRKKTVKRPKKKRKK